MNAYNNKLNVIIYLTIIGKDQVMTFHPLTSISIVHLIYANVNPDHKFRTYLQCHAVVNSQYTLYIVSV